MTAPATPRVSCIIIFRNEETYLPEAVASVRRQSFMDWELLLVDDGSDDGSEALGRRFATEDPGRIRYLHHPGRENRGMSASRNLGIENARGRFVAFLDGDDTWLESKLQQQVDLFSRHPEAAMVCGATLYWYSGGAEREAAPPDRVVQVGDTPDAANVLDALWGTSPAPDASLVVPGRRLLRLLRPLGLGASPSTSGFMVRREVFETVGRFEEEFRGLFEDQTFKTKLYLHAPVCISRLCFDRYRRHAGSCTVLARSIGDTQRREVLFLTWLEGYFRGQEVKDPALLWRLRFLRSKARFPGTARLLSGAARRARGGFPAWGRVK